MASLSESLRKKTQTALRNEERRRLAQQASEFKYWLKEEKAFWNRHKVFVRGALKRAAKAGKSSVEVLDLGFKPPQSDRSQTPTQCQGYRILNNSDLQGAGLLAKQWIEKLGLKATIEGDFDCNSDSTSYSLVASWQ